MCRREDKNVLHPRRLPNPLTLVGASGIAGESTTCSVSQSLRGLKEFLVCGAGGQGGNYDSDVFQSSAADWR